jgi:nucleotide-binding universal stress UspA family protein
MATHQVPQPGPDRMVPAAGHPLVMGIVPGQPDLVTRTAAMWAEAARATTLYCAYVDQSRFTAEEFPDGTVRHAPIDPDGMDDDWRRNEQRIVDHLSQTLAGTTVPWTFRYLAGRPDRALTHLARAVDASAYVIGTRAPRAGSRMREFLDGSVAFRLSHHQHRPVLVVPLEVVDWKATLWR